MIRFTKVAAGALGLAIVAIATLAAQAKHWAYEDRGDAVGPAKWGALPGNAACASGKEQSPIDLAAGVTKPQDLPDLVFAYKPTLLAMTNPGHTVRMNYGAGSALGRTGTTTASALVQFHFHTPSEHTVDGASYPMEAHLVHVDAAGKPAAVVAVLILAGREHAGLARAFQALPAKSGDNFAPAGVMVDARTLLPADKTFFTYAGSLTTPPCTEGLTWYVLKTPIELSPAQIGAFTKLEHLAHTNRPVQSLGGRAVVFDSTPGR